jgi:hypothetical protein
MMTITTIFFGFAIVGVHGFTPTYHIRLAIDQIHDVCFNSQGAALHRQSLGAMLLRPTEFINIRFHRRRICILHHKPLR